MGKYKVDEGLLVDKDIVISGKKGKPSQLYSLYIFRVLTEDADYSNPLKCTEIIDSIVERFNVVIDLATIQRYINVFKKSLNDYILEGDAYDGYYLRPTEDAAIVIPAYARIDGSEVNLLVQMVRSVDYLNESDKKNIINFLSCIGDKDLQAYIQKNKMIASNEEKWSGRGKRELKAYILRNMPEVIQYQKVVQITAREIVTYGRSESYRNKEMCIYASFPIGETSFYIVGRMLDNDEIVCIRAEDVEEFKILETTFEKTKVRVNSKYAIIENNMREFLKNEKHFTMPTKQEEIKYQKYVEWLGALGRDERVKHIKEHGHEPYVYMKYPK